ncbi:MAG: hypothetical protein K0B16_08545 [Burkholderiaceae bacterium]|nr:hypothetical protein [Burkholderiaceae bacterium]
MSTRATAKPMVATYEGQRAPGQPLVFLGGWLFSAAFYTDGAERRLPDSDEGWRRLGSGGGFVAVDVRSRAALAPQPGRVVTKVGHFDAYDLMFVAPQDQAASSVNENPAVAR